LSFAAQTVKGCYGEIQAKVSDLRRLAFQEQDQTIIKAQQNVMLGQPQPEHPVLLEIDIGPVRYKKVLDSLIKQEQESAQVAQGGRAA
jgi:vanillate O-demethylase monooxygenase subunit